MNPEMEYYGRKFKADIRTLRDMESVIYDKKWLSRADTKTPLYYMFRDVWRSERDREILKSNGIRYDITTIPSTNLGNEFVKTYGHGHPCPHGSSHSFPELYEVLEGTAHYLLQSAKKKVDDVIVIEAKKGDVVLVPPDYEHITINPSKNDLKMANLVAFFQSTYDRIKTLGGAAYFETVGKEWVKNSNYGKLPEIRFAKPCKFFKSDIYNLITDPRQLEFLKNPDEALNIEVF
jgi:glucose-6-phosphate isomerase